jgi:hypothetical protein
MSAAGSLDIQHYNPPEVETGSAIGLAPQSAPSLPGSLPLFETLVGGEWLPLRRPIRLRVRAEEGFIFVENDTLGLFGHGHSLASAVAEFRRDLEYYWKYDGQLGEHEVAQHGVRLKKVYDSLF